MDELQIAEMVGNVALALVVLLVASGAALIAGLIVQIGWGDE